MPLRQRGFVQDQLVGRPVRLRGRGAAIPFAILRAGLEGAPIDIVAILLRHRRVIFLDAPLHFLEQPVDQRLVRRHRAFEPAIFRLQIGQDILVLHLRITRIAQPGIGILHLDAMVGKLMEAAFGDGRAGGRRALISH